MVKKKGLIIKEIPVKYCIRQTGKSNMKPFRDGIMFGCYILKRMLNELSYRKRLT